MFERMRGGALREEFCYFAARAEGEALAIGQRDDVAATLAAEESGRTGEVVRVKGWDRMEGERWPGECLSLGSAIWA
jgi:hypothetical protein